MAVRFIIGRAGSGKTHHCLEAVRAQLRHHPIDGPRLILLVPEQASLQMERSLLSLEDVSAVHRAEVLSFQRLAYKVIESVGRPLRRALSETARTMVLRHLVRDQADRLTYYRRASQLGGFVDRLSQTVSELFQEAVTPEDLLGGAETPDADDPVRAAKLHDLHIIFSSYLEYLGDDKLDPSQYLEVARECLPRCPWLAGARLWVDGFASMSGQENLTLIALANLCHDVDITVMDDPSGSSLTAGAPADFDFDTLFGKTRRTYRQLRAAFLDAGLEVGEPLLMRGTPPPRFRDCDDLARLERDWFSVGTRRNDNNTDPRAHAIELAELPSRRIEVDYAVARICEWVQNPNSAYRYRDLAIIVRELDLYHDLVSNALNACGIPFFIDRRRPTAHHPLVELLRAGTALAAESLSLGSVRQMLKTGLVPIAAELSDELENYLIAHGLNGWDAWSGEDWSFVTRSSFAQSGQVDDITQEEVAALKRINAARRTFMRFLEPWLSFVIKTDTPTGSAWAAALRAWLDHLHVAATLKSWCILAEADSDADQAAEHRQVWLDTAAFLDDVGFAFENVKLTTQELSEVIEQGLSTLTLGLAPPMIDQLLVGSIERSRHPDIKAAVLIGFNDGVFPKQFQEDSIFNDDDRVWLRDRGVDVRSPLRERVLDETMLAYIALTRASDAMLVTYATADDEGQALRPSPYVDSMMAACPGLKINVLSDPARARETWDILSPKDLTKRLAMEFRARPALAEDDPALRGRWNELYDSLRVELATDAVARSALASLGEPREARLCSRSVERLFGGTLRTSVSQLETYAACPFQHFARYGLKLRERAEAVLAPVDVGQVHHAIMEDFVSGLADRHETFTQLSEGQMLQRLKESFVRVESRLPSRGALSTARDTYMLRRSASQLARVLTAQRNVSKHGSARPKATELPFGMEHKTSLPAMELSTPAGRRVLLRGFIDRVDLAELGDELLGIVIDYKQTRDKKLNLSEVYHGLSLQLVAYLLALREHGESLAGRPIRPIAALYVSLASRYQAVDHPSLLTARDASLDGTFRPRGLLLAERFDAMDNALGKGWSEHYSYFRKEGGTIGHIDSSDAADASAFEATLDHTRTRLGELSDGILDGDVAVKPYRLGTHSPCSWCPLASVCRFEMGISEVRYLESLKRSEVFARFKKE